MDLQDIYNTNQAIIKPLKINIPDDLGMELCQDWLQIKKLIENNWKFYIPNITDMVDIQILIDWICKQYRFYNKLSEKDRMIVEDKIIGISKPEDVERLNKIINSSPLLPKDIVVQYGSKQQTLKKEVFVTNIDPSKTFNKLDYQNRCCYNFIQLTEGTDCLVTFPTLDILLPSDVNLYPVDTKNIKFVYGDQTMELLTSFYLSITDLDLIDRFCEEPTKEVFDLFTDEVKVLWKNWCNWCVTQNRGDVNLAKKILSYL